ncbi:CCA tRNA nucleotidyltransferase [Aliiroseovarius sp. KMU-50]|uniref:CCA tRNA nucleotidyltransferase n=1 Tax=Aliiroseovarius salicola TaxID=3009082 RepID=A0ABT4VZE7_9RHOB|nr:CCA tRNA nucleotidyltransferase [Aliiroseovarius sp. KMU-50]MDA5092957.1 CCA tRNA nucleotidyltransferase [Aliiroseovarius sp. KMU-50]
MTQLQGSWFKAPNVLRLSDLFDQAGYQLHFVGGCVRNALIREPISDLDLSTNARPDEVLRLAKNSGLKAVPTGIDHGTVTVVVDGEGFEITTYRKDVETDGRRAVVAFADTMEEDAHRRDFTMNALYADVTGLVIDPLGGIADLNARRVRFIDDAGERIREDYLRTLRFFRFHAWYGDDAEGPDPDALDAIASNLDGLETLSRERVGVELLKLLSAPDPSPALSTMSKCGVLGVLLPGADAKSMALLVHLEADRKTDPIRRLALLGGENLADRLRLSRKDAKRLAVLGSAMSNMVPVSELAYREGADIAMNAALLRAAMFEQPLPEGVEEDIQSGAAATFPIKPVDLMDRLQGPALGAKLKELEARWIASDFTLTREELLS